MNEEKIRNQWNSSTLKHILTILGLILCNFSCNEKNEKVMNSPEQNGTRIVLHRTVLSDLPADSKPSQIFLDKVPKPKSEQLPGHGVKNINNTPGSSLSIRKLTALVRHLFIDTLTGLPIPEDAQGKGLFTTYTTDNGLALDHVYSSYKDKNGNLWFGTIGGGVSKYDGKTFTNYTNLQGLAGNTVWSIIEDKNGNLWFGTDGNGASKYDGKVFTNYTVHQGLANDLVMSIKEDRIGNLWFGTFKGGVSKYDGRNFTNYSTEQGLANNAVSDIIEDENGEMWFGTLGGGVSRFDGKHFTTYTTANGLSNNTIRSIHQDKKGNIWFGTNGGGLNVYDGEKFTSYTNAHGLANNIVLTVTEDKKGNIWAGTSGGGASKFDGQRFTNYTKSQGLANNDVQCITEDDRGNLWFGTFGGGISKFEGNSFNNYTENQGLPNNVVFSITEDNSGNLWFGTFGGGVCKYDRKSFTSYNFAQGLANNLIYCVAKDRNGNLWFGTLNGGIIKFDGKNFINYTTEQGLANNVVFCIKEDKSGNLWFGTSGGGVSKFDGKSFTNFTKSQGLPHNVVFCITEDKKGNLWFGTSGAGISKFDGKGFTNFSSSQGLLNNVVWAITEDRDCNIWVGTEQGLCFMHKKNVAMLQRINATDTTLTSTLFQSFTNKDGLPDNFVTQVLQGNEQKLYIGTNLGICEIMPGALANGSEKQWHVGRIFNSYTGYPVKDVNAGTGAMFKDSRGIIWIGTGSDKTGLVRFDPQAEISNSDKPLFVVIQSIKINHQSLIWNDLDSTYTAQATKTKHTPPGIAEEINAFGRQLSDAERIAVRKKFGDISFQGIRSWYPIPENLVLPYDKNSISFEFIAIETDKNHLVKYQYMLERYDNDWSPPDYKTSATFGNIHEGSYTFKIRSQSPEGLWSEPVTYNFRVLPPWWRTWWMYILYAIIVIALIVLIFRWNLKRIIHQKNVLLHKVDVATRQIREEKENVEAQKKIVEDTLKELESAQAQLIQAEKMASLGQLIAGIAHEINTPIGAINASIATIADSTSQSLKLLPDLVKTLSGDELKLFMELVKKSAIINNSLTSKEEREIRKKIATQLEEKGIAEADDFADILVDMGIYDEIENYLPLYKTQTMKAAYHLSMQTKNSQNIKMAVDRASKVVFALKNYARYDNDQRMVEANIVDGLETVLTLYQNQMKHGITLHKEYEEIPSILCYPDELNQVWTNLIHNAIQAMDGKGELSIHVETYGRTSLRVSITDTGKGIPPEIKDRIFDAFFTTKPAGEGSGLGLYILKQIIDKHKGTITFESEMGKGTSFMVCFPNNN